MKIEEKNYLLKNSFKDIDWFSILTVFYKTRRSVSDSDINYVGLKGLKLDINRT